MKVVDKHTLLTRNIVKTALKIRFLISIYIFFKYKLLYISELKAHFPYIQKGAVRLFSRIQTFVRIRNLNRTALHVSSRETQQKTVNGQHRDYKNITGNDG